MEKAIEKVLRDIGGFEEKDIVPAAKFISMRARAQIEISQTDFMKTNPISKCLKKGQ